MIFVERLSREDSVDLHTAENRLSSDGTDGLEFVVNTGTNLVLIEPKSTHAFRMSTGVFFFSFDERERLSLRVLIVNVTSNHNKTKQP